MIPFEQLIPMPVERFKDEFQNKKWFIQKKDDGRFKEHFSWKEFDQYMNSYGLNGHQRMPQCQIVGDKKYCHKKAEKKLTKEQIYEHWKNGDSFILTLCEFLNKTMWQQCVEFEKHFGRGQANIYCSSQKDAKCFPTHADTTENFLFHVRGKIRWYIMNEYEWDCPPEDATVQKVVDLDDGDLLYLPSKLYHRVDTLGPRISISFHFHTHGDSKREDWIDWLGDING